MNDLNDLNDSLNDCPGPLNDFPCLGRSLEDHSNHSKIIQKSFTQSFKSFTRTIPLEFSSNGNRVIFSMLLYMSVRVPGHFNLGMLHTSPHASKPQVNDR